MRKNIFQALVAVFAFAALSFVHAAVAPLSPEESKKQEDFKKAYGSTGKKDRIEAVQHLDGCAHPTTIQMLQTVISVDTYPEVKGAAFRILTNVPATDPGVSQMCAQIFDSLKPMDFETHMEFVPQLRNLEFKYPVFEMLCDYGSKLRYPDLVTYSQYGGDPNVQIRKTRAEFDKFLKAFNLVTNAGLPLQDKNTPSTIRTWWNNNKDKILATDKELLEKYRAEDADRRNKALAAKEAAIASKEPAPEKPPVEKAPVVEKVVDKAPVVEKKTPAPEKAPVAEKTPEKAPAADASKTSAKKKVSKDDE